MWHAIIDPLDNLILGFLTGFAGRSAAFDHLVNAVARLDLFKGTALMALFWFAWAKVTPGEIARMRDLRRDRLVMILIGSLLIGGLSRGLQLLLHVHQRPIFSAPSLSFPMQEANALHFATWNSFPSDHSMLFFALSMGLWTVDRRCGVIAFAWSLVMIDLPRIYLGVHYPSDVVAGSLLGIGLMLIFLRLPLHPLKNLLSSWRHANPGVFVAVLFLAIDQTAHLLADFRDLAHGVWQVLLRRE